MKALILQGVAPAELPATQVAQWQAGRHPEGGEDRTPSGSQPGKETGSDVMNRREPLRKERWGAVEGFFHAADGVLRHLAVGATAAVAGQTRLQVRADPDRLDGDAVPRRDGEGLPPPLRE